jgi:hypothetical protein
VRTHLDQLCLRSTFLSVPLSFSLCVSLCACLYEYAHASVRACVCVHLEGALDADLDLKRAIAEGWVVGPRMFIVSRAIVSTGGYEPKGACWRPSAVA